MVCVRGAMSISPTHSAARYEETAPPRAIAEWVEAIWWICGNVGMADDAGVRWHDVLPDGCADWVVPADSGESDGDSGRVKSVFVGPMTRRRLRSAHRREREGRRERQGQRNAGDRRYRRSAMATALKRAEALLIVS
jgi:hypothetical protein